jgi:Putative prokaryotic signal transducing protein
LVEILRTNDLVLISVIEAILKAERIAFFVADQHMAAAEGSLGFLPRRILVDARAEGRARRAIAEAGLAGELRDG